MLSQEQHTIVNLRLLSLLPRGNMKLFHAKQRKIFSHGHNIQNIQLKCLIFSSVPLKRSPEPKINHQSPLQAVLKGRSHLLHPSGFKVTMRRPISWRGPELLHVFHAVWMTISHTAYEKTIAGTCFHLPVGGNSESDSKIGWKRVHGETCTVPEKGNSGQMKQSMLRTTCCFLVTCANHIIF